MTQHIGEGFRLSRIIADVSAFRPCASSEVHTKAKLTGKEVEQLLLSMALKTGLSQLKSSKINGWSLLRIVGYLWLTCRL